MSHALEWMICARPLCEPS